MRDMRHLGLFFFVAAIGLVILGGCSRPAASPRDTPAPTPKRETIVRSTNVSVVILPAKEKGRLNSVVIQPGQANIYRGGMFPFTATAYDDDGRPVQDVRLAWQAHPDAGQIDSFGIFTASGEPGSFANSITVVAEQPWQGLAITRTASASVSILAPLGSAQLDYVKVFPEPVQAAPGQIVRLYAVGYDTRGNPMPGLQFRWAVRDGGAGRTNALGYFTAGIVPGSYDDALLVEAVQRTETGTISRSAIASVVIREPAAAVDSRLMGLDVVPGFVSLMPGQQIQLYAVGYYSLGSPARDVDVGWQLVEPGAGSIDRSGLFTAGDKPGAYDKAILATGTQQVEGTTIVQEAYGSVIITPPENGHLSNLKLFPPQVVLLPGAETKLGAAGTDARGYIVSELDLSWQMVRPEAGEVTARGDFVAGHVPGTYPQAIMVTATQDTSAAPVALSAYADVIIVGRLHSVKPRPATIAIAQGQSVQLQALGYDENGIAIPWLDVRWRMANAGAGEVLPLGLFRATGPPGEYPDAIEANVTQELP